jgi:hypothetical protein
MTRKSQSPGQGAPAVPELAGPRGPTEGERTPTLEAKPERRLAVEVSAAEEPAAQQAPAEPLVRAAQTPAMQSVPVAQLAPVARQAPVAVPVVRLTAAERPAPAAAGWTAAPGRPAQVVVRTPGQTVMEDRLH